MFVSGLAAFALCISSTFATPLLGSLSGSKIDVHPKDDSLPRLMGRAVNDAGGTDLPTCHRDDLYELFSDPENKAAASAFCSIYIAFSSLDRATVTPTYTTTVNLTATRGITSSPVAITTTAPSSATCSSQNVTDVAATDTSRNSTATVVPPQLKRQAPPLPPAEADTYPALRLSSVCSCLVVPSTVVTTLTETASAEAITEMETIQVTANTPQTQRSSAVTNASSSKAGNATAGTTSTVSQNSNDTTMATGATSWTSSGAARTTVTTSLTANITTVTTAGISSTSKNAANATATSGQTRNNTTTTGIPRPTGTSNSSAPAAYCDSNFVRGNGTFLARYTVRCNYSYTNLAPMRVESRPSYGACVRECDNDSRCYGFSYLLSGDGENCYIYNYYPLPAGHPDDLFDSGSYVVGSNNGMKH